MMQGNSFRAYRNYLGKDGQSFGQFDLIRIDDLTPGDVVVKVAYSSVNYKDALVSTGKGSILKSSPLVGGIDLAGTVISSDINDFEVGDQIIAAGHTLSERIDGGYSEFARLPANAVTKLPKGLSLRDAITIGTAGVTAAVAIIRMEDNGLRPEDGPVAVTGATGGVGSFAIDILSTRGYEVTALTRKKEETAYLEKLGANKILILDEIEMMNKELNSALFAGAIDNLGGDILRWLISSVKPLGSVACIGLVVDDRLSCSIMPFILRSVSLLGINSHVTPKLLDCAPWDRLATDLRPSRLDIITRRVVTLDELPVIFNDYINGAIVGRTIVKIDDAI